VPHLTDKVIAQVSLPSPTFGRLRFTPDGRQVVVVQGRWLGIVDAAARREIAALEMRAEGKVIAVSPDGTRAAVSNPAADSITIVDLSAPRVVSSFGVGRTPDGVFWLGSTSASAQAAACNDSFPAWSPDGTRIAYSSDRTGSGPRKICGSRRRPDEMRIRRGPPTDDRSRFRARVKASIRTST
jgi:DNA-binding beta-propeller fold protein YncE